MNFLKSICHFICDLFDRSDYVDYSVQLIAEYECTLLIEAESEEHAKASVDEALFTHLMGYVKGPGPPWELSEYLDVHVASCNAVDEAPK